MGNGRGHRSFEGEARSQARQAAMRQVKHQHGKQRKRDGDILREQNTRFEPPPPHAQWLDEPRASCSTSSPTSTRTTPSNTSSPDDTLIATSEDGTKSQSKSHRGFRSKEARARRRQVYLDTPWPELKRTKAKKVLEESGEWKDFPLRFRQRKMSELDGLVLDATLPQEPSNACSNTTATAPACHWDVLDGRRLLVHDTPNSPRALNKTKLSFTIQGKLSKGVWKWDPPKPGINCTSCDNPYYSLTLSPFPPPPEAANASDIGVSRPASHGESSFVFSDVMERLRLALMRNTSTDIEGDWETPIIYLNDQPERHNIGFLLPVQEGGDTRVYATSGEDVGANEISTRLSEANVEVDFIVQHCVHDGGRRDGIRAVVERIQLLGGHLS